MWVDKYSELDGNLLVEIHARIIGNAFVTTEVIVVALIQKIFTTHGYMQGVLAQALIASVAGYAIGFLLARLLGFVLPSTVPVAFLPATAASLFLATVAMGGLGAAFSFRRIVRIDPASALGGEA